MLSGIAATHKKDRTAAAKHLQEHVDEGELSQIGLVQTENLHAQDALLVEGEKLVQILLQSRHLEQKKRKTNEGEKTMKVRKCEHTGPLSSI